MEEAKDPKSATKLADRGAEGGDRRAEATSRDTLRDLEKTQNVAAKERSETTDDSISTSMPAPDGSPSADRSGRTDGSDPM